MKKEKIHVLIFPAHSIELHDALATSVNIELYGASSKDMGAEFYFKNYKGDLPLISDPEFLPIFNVYLVENHIDLIFTHHETIALFLARHQGEIKAKLMISDVHTAEVCRDKNKTYELFADCFFVPTIFRTLAALEFPAFLKPIEGQGGQGSRCIRYERELPKDWHTSFVLSEYLPGEEVTVDCLTDQYGELRVISPRSRERILGGICVAGRMIALSDEIKQIAETINERLHFLGLWYFQIKKDKKGFWKLLEVSARCAGTMGFTRARGINLPLLSVYIAMGREISIQENPYQLTMSRHLFSAYNIDYHWSVVYFDYDDTLIVNGQVNLMAIAFLYQCRNKGKKVFLLTKHVDEIYVSMRQHCIDKSLFDKIIQIAPEEKKSSYINVSKEAIFIDNAYKERQDVYEKWKIPVFDVDNINVLMDWRI